MQGSVPGTSSQKYKNCTRTERHTSVNNSGNSEHMTTEISTNRQTRSLTIPPTVPSSTIGDSSYSSAATADDNAMHSEPAASQEWTLVQRRKPKKYLTGSKASASGALQGLQQTKDLYVGRCMSSVETNDIVDYIKSEFDINFDKCVCISKEEYHAKAFKVTVLSNQIDELLAPEQRPEHIRVRKYFVRFPSSNDRRI